MHGYVKYVPTCIMASCLAATKGDDYVPGPYIVTFPAGVTSVSFNVSIIDDNMLESDEHIFLRINSSSLPSGFNVDPSQARLTIVNDDCK